MRSRRADGSRTAPDRECAPGSRAFSITAIESDGPPLAFCSCESRIAADRPAGPAPTIRMSKSIESRAATGVTSPLFERRNQGWHDLEEVANDAVVGNLEDRRIGVFVDGHDGPRALHPHDVLNGAGDADGDIQRRRHRLARA